MPGMFMVMLPITVPAGVAGSVNEVSTLPGNVFTSTGCAAMSIGISTGAPTGVRQDALFIPAPAGTAAPWQMV